MKSISKLKDEARRHEQREEWEKAIQVYLQVIRVGDEGEGDVELTLFNRIGDLCVRLGRPLDAVRHYEEAADRYADAGLYNNAIALCNKAMRYQPDHLELMRKLGQFSASQGFLTDARRYFLEYAERKFKAGETDAALSALADFAGVVDDGEVRELLGRRLHAYGREDKALTELRTAWSMYMHTGESGRADAVRELIHSIDPDATLESAAPRPPTDTISERAGSATDGLPHFEPLGFERGFPAAPPPAAPPPPVEGLQQTGHGARADNDDDGFVELPFISFDDDREAEPDTAIAAEPVSGFETTSLDFEAAAQGLRELDMGPGFERDDAPADVHDDVSDDEAAFLLPDAAPAGAEPEPPPPLEASAPPDAPRDGEDAFPPAYDLPLLDDPESSAVELPLLDEPADTPLPLLDEFDAEDRPDADIDADLPLLDGSEDDDFASTGAADAVFPDEVPAASDFTDFGDFGRFTAEPPVFEVEQIPPMFRPEDLTPFRTAEVPFDYSDPRDETPSEPDWLSEPPAEADIEAGAPPEAVNEPEPFTAAADADPVDAAPFTGAAPELDPLELPGWITETSDPATGTWNVPGAFEIGDEPRPFGAERASVPGDDDDAARVGPEADDDFELVIDVEIDMDTDTDLEDDQPATGSDIEAGAGPGDADSQPRIGAQDLADLFARLDYGFDTDAEEKDATPAEAPAWLDTDAAEPWLTAEEPAAEAETTEFDEDAGGLEGDAVDTFGADPARDPYPDAVADEWQMPWLGDASADEAIVADAGTDEEIGYEDDSATPEQAGGHAFGTDAGFAFADEPATAQQGADPADPPDDALDATPEPAGEAAVAEPAPDRPAPPRAAPADAEDEFVDLAALIRGEDAEATTRFYVQETPPTGDEDRDFTELLSQFKAKIAEHVSADDDAAHYDLALAYKEMGLLDEAIASFQIALRAGRMRLKIYEEIGECFLLKRQFNIAEKVLNRALTTHHEDELELLGVYYHLGRAYEAMGRTEQARDAYERVLGMDIGFQDVTERLSRL